MITPYYSGREPRDAGFKTATVQGERENGVKQVKMSNSMNSTRLPLHVQNNANATALLPMARARSVS